ncbi:MAG: hypothetical protein J6D29_07265 [Solobacterium sp.]|nr:hypothetical protein [Solobacterium sp.]
MKFKRGKRLIFLFVSMILCIVFAIGVYDFFTIPPKAKAAAEEIEVMLRKNQEEANERRKQAREEARQREEDKPATLRDLYTDASQMNVVGVGDSVMLAALPQLYERFPNGYFDAVFGRTLYEGRNTVYELEQEDGFGDVVVYSLITNSYVEEADIEDIIAHSGGRPTFWITTFGVTNDSNAKLQNVLKRHSNAYLIDWETLAMEHIGEYILSDGLHPNEVGSRAYAELIRRTINNALLGPLPMWPNPVPMEK